MSDNEYTTKAMSKLKEIEELRKRIKALENQVGNDIEEPVFSNEIIEKLSSEMLGESNNRQIKKGLDSWPDISIQCKEYTREEIKKMYEGTNNEIIELNKMADLYGLDWENTPNGIIIGHLFTGKNSKEIIEKIFKHYGWSKRDD